MRCIRCARCRAFCGSPSADGARLERACARALAAGDGRYQTVRGILERGLEALPLEEPGEATTSGAYLRGADAFTGMVG
jgi:hypothetical protein